MRPVSVFASSLDEAERLRAELRGRWRLAVRAVMVLSPQGLPAAQIAGLLECHPARARRWIGRFNSEGLAGLADQPAVRTPPGGRAAAEHADRRATAARSATASSSRTASPT